MQRPDDKKANPDWNWELNKYLGFKLKATYFAAKKQKLNQQYESEKNESDDEKSSTSKTLFKNIGILVNGYTRPTAIELKSIMLKHGGLYFEYMNDKVTYIIANNLAYSKALLLKNKLVVKPEWITDCLKENKLLRVEPYILMTKAHDKNQNKLTNYIKDSKLELASKAVKKTPKMSKMTQRKSGRHEPILIDLCESPKPLVESTEPDKTQQESKTNDQIYQDYIKFTNKLKNVRADEKASSHNIINKHRPVELELERIKIYLHEWICLTTNNIDEMSGIYFNPNSTNTNVELDIHVFANYLLYLLSVSKNLEMLTIIMKIFRRLVYKNGSFEWISAYDNTLATVQREFSKIYHFNLELN